MNVTVSSTTLAPSPLSTLQYVLYEVDHKLLLIMSWDRKCHAKENVIRS